MKNSYYSEDKTIKGLKIFNYRRIIKTLNILGRLFGLLINNDKLCIKFTDIFNDIIYVVAYSIYK